MIGRGISMCDVENTMSELAVYRDQLKSDVDRLREEQQKWDCAQEDILHYIELERLELTESYNTLRRLKEVRIRRRETKDKLSAISSLYKYVDTSIKQTENILKQQKNRAYKIRVLTDLPATKIVKGKPYFVGEKAV